MVKKKKKVHHIIRYNNVQDLVNFRTPCFKSMEDRKIFPLEDAHIKEYEIGICLDATKIQKEMVWKTYDKKEKKHQIKIKLIIKIIRNVRCNNAEDPEICNWIQLYVIISMKKKEMENLLGDYDSYKV